MDSRQTLSIPTKYFDTLLETQGSPTGQFMVPYSAHLGITLVSPHETPNLLPSTSSSNSPFHFALFTLFKTSATDTYRHLLTAVSVYLWHTRIELAESPSILS